MAEDKIRVGIIGASARYGWGMRSHLPALLGLPEYELAAVCTSSHDTAKEAARHYGARMAFDDYKEMVQHPEVDVVSVSVRVPLHYSMVMAALAAGKHVFCEWPLGANMAETENMATLAQSKGVQNIVTLQSRTDPALMRLRELIEEGYVGEVLSCSMTMFLPGILERGSRLVWTADRLQGATTLSISTGHAIDALCFCVGEFKEVWAMVTTQVPVWEFPEIGKTVDVTSPDNVMVIGTLSNGAVASFHTAMIPWNGSGSRIEVYGREGTLVASTRGMIQYAGIRLQGNRAKASHLELLDIPDRLNWVPSEMPNGPPFNVAQMYRRLAEAIRGQEAAGPDFKQAVRTQNLLDAIQRSSDTGAKVLVS